MGRPIGTKLTYLLMQTKPLKNCRGFTLIEAMVTVAVAAILVVVAVPGMTSVLLDNRRTSTVNKFFTGFQIARSEAISRNQRVVVCRSKSGESCDGKWSDGIIVFADEDQDQARDVGEPTLYTVGDMDDLSITSAAFPSFLSYRPNGRIMVATVRDNSGNFEICDHRGADHARVLIIDTSGRPRVSQTDEDGMAASC